VSRRVAGWRDSQLDRIAELLGTTPRPRILAGDLNATPWSAPVASLRSRTGLEIVGGGPGATGTWPTWLPMPRVHIDHVLFDRSIRVRAHHVGPDIGSDHLPVLVDLELPSDGSSHRTAPRASKASRGVS
jgi:endonuclease/exonuclease/phosphatase (EEP) superfamily protein YafD